MGLTGDSKYVDRHGRKICNGIDQLRCIGKYLSPISSCWIRQTLLPFFKKERIYDWRRKRKEVISKVSIINRCSVRAGFLSDEIDKRDRRLEFYQIRFLAQLPPHLHTLIMASIVKSFTFCLSIYVFCSFIPFLLFFFSLSLNFLSLCYALFMSTDDF